MRVLVTRDTCGGYPNEGTVTSDSCRGWHQASVPLPLVDVLMQVLVRREPCGECPNADTGDSDSCGGCPNVGTGDT